MGNDDGWMAAVVEAVEAGYVVVPKPGQGPTVRQDGRILRVDTLSCEKKLATEVRAAIQK
jgi:hypothetical protein